VFAVVLLLIQVSLATQSASSDPGVLKPFQQDLDVYALEADNTASLGKLPKEIMILIFKDLLAKGDLAASVSLGLTCNLLYSILKYADPESMAFMNHREAFTFIPYMTRGTREALIDIVASFLGDDYRGVWAGNEHRGLMSEPHYRSYHFLNIEVYGTEGSEAQKRFESGCKTTLI
jgi:hypothetical protein